MAGRKNTAAEKAQNIGNAFTKEQILSAAEYQNRRDLLGVLLENSKKYTFLEVDQLVERFMKGTVN